MTESAPSDLPPEPSRQRRSPGQALRRFWGRISLSNLQIILIILIVIGGRLVIDFGQRILEGQQKVAQEQTLDAQIQALLAEQQQLQADKVYYGSPAYTEAWAHGEGKMVRQGEKIVIPLYKGQPRPPAPLATAQPPPSLPKWYVWWVLFFDAQPPAGWVSPSPSGK